MEAVMDSKIPFRLYFLHQPMCGACALAKPELAKFMRDHPEGLRVDIHAGRHPRGIAGFKPKATPSYLIIPSGEKEGLPHEGPLAAEDLEEMLKSARGAQSGEEEDNPEEKEGEEEE
jgi:hypothetical protein